MRKNNSPKRVYNFSATYKRDFGFGIVWEIYVEGWFTQREESDEIEGYVYEQRNGTPRRERYFIRGTYNKKYEELLYIRAEYGNFPLVYAFFWKDGTGKWMAYDQEERQAYFLPYNGKVQIQDITECEGITSASRKTVKKTIRTCRKGEGNPIVKGLLEDYERARRHLRI